VYPRPLYRALPVIAVVVAALLAGCGSTPTSYKITPVPSDRTLEEATMIEEGGFLPAKIVLIDVDGVIVNKRSSGLLSEGEHPVSLFVEKLDKAANDSSVKGLVIRINSPGGSVTASDIMYQELVHWKERTCHKKPVVGMMMDVAASGGYYLSCGCDEIVAEPTTVTGSIGVIMQMFNVVGTMRKIGVETDAVKSGKMKDAGSPFREIKPEERQVFQRLVDNYFDRFVKVVVAGRPKLDEAKVRAVADGRVYSAQEALELGFIDKIGSLREALADVKDQIGAKHVRVVTYQRPLGWKPNIYAENPAPAPQMNMINIQLPESWAAYSEPQFMYLWAPGL
jgi:protease IV